MSIFSNINGSLGNLGSSVQNSLSSIKNIGNSGANLSSFISGKLNLSDSVKETLITGANFNKFNATSVDSMIEKAKQNAHADHLVYPLDLYNTRRGQDHATIIFTVNVNEDSKYAKNRKSEVGEKKDTTGQNTAMTGGVGDVAGKIKALGDVAGTAFSTAGSAAGNAASAAGNSAKNVTNAAVGGLGDLISGAVGGLGSLAKFSASGLGMIGDLIGSTNTAQAVSAEAGKATVAMENTVTEIGQQLTKPLRKLKRVIAMPMPNNIAVQYGAEYGGIELGMMGGILDQNITAAGIKSAGTEAIKNNKTKYAVGLLSSTGLDIAKGAAQKAGVAMNPRKEIVFNDMAKRSFNYEFTFAPTSIAEYKNVLEIINTFKIHMHPEFFDDLRVMYRTPSEFDIEYQYAGSQNESLHKISTCFLESMSVNYTPNGQWTNHEKGYPTQIQMSLSFKEMETLTRERVTEFELSQGNYKL